MIYIAATLTIPTVMHVYNTSGPAPGDNIVTI